jgi:riboflavin transporter FmnP
MSRFSSKEIMFIAIMAALGNVLSFLSIQLVPLLPSIQFGMINISIALDFSHLTTLVAAYFGGPLIGGLTGILGGLVSAHIFGFSSGNYITGVLLPLGKGVAGIGAGVLYKRLRVEKDYIKNVFVTVISFIPEAGVIYLIFMILMPAFMGLPKVVALPLTIQINVKALGEMVILGILMGTILRNKGFSEYIRSMFSDECK